MYSLVFPVCLALFIGVKAHGEGYDKPTVLYNNPYLWMLSNQLFQLNLEVKNLKQTVDVKSRKIDTLTRYNNNLNITHKKQQEKMSSLEKQLDLLTKSCNLTSKRVDALDKELAEKIERLNKEQDKCKCQEVQVKCKPGWDPYRGNCYYFGNEKMTWQTAETKCKQLGSHLVKIGDADIYNWIVLKYKEKQILSPWIGLNDKQKEGQWRWISDNSLATYFAWNQHEPNNAGGSENCVIFRPDDTWNDGECNNWKSHYICEV